MVDVVSISNEESRLMQWWTTNVLNTPEMKDRSDLRSVLEEWGKKLDKQHIKDEILIHLKAEALWNLGLTDEALLKFVMKQIQRCFRG